MYLFSTAITSDSDEEARGSDCGPTASAGPAILLLDAARHVMMATPPARAALNRGRPLALIAGTMCAADREEGIALSTAFHALVTGRAATRSLRLGAKANELALQLVALCAEDSSTQIVVTLQSLGHDMSARVDSAVRRFGLTPAESRLLGVLCGGASLIEASARLDVAYTTVRTHLQRIFDKSGTHRQAELIHIVLAA